MCGVMIGIVILTVIFQMLKECVGTVGATIISVLFVLLSIVIGKVSENTAAKKEKSLNEIRKKEFDVISDFIKNKGFIADKSVCFKFESKIASDFKEEDNYFLVDDMHKQFAILRCGKNNQEEILKINDWSCYSYSVLLDFDVRESGVSVLSGRGCNAAVGAALGGLTGIGSVTGAVIGSVAGSERINEECSSLIINIIVNDFKKPLISIDCLGGKIYKKGSSEYKEIIKSVNETTAALTYIYANKSAVPQEAAFENNVVEQASNEIKNISTLQRVCSNCGSVLEIDSVFCGNCGKKYEEEV